MYEAKIIEFPTSIFISTYDVLSIKIVTSPSKLFHLILLPDIDECEDAAVAQMSLCGESMLCNNTEGGFECICPAGTQLFDNICEIPRKSPKFVHNNYIETKT